MLLIPHGLIKNKKGRSKALFLTKPSSLYHINSIVCWLKYKWIKSQLSKLLLVFFLKKRLQGSALQILVAIKNTQLQQSKK